MSLARVWFQKEARSQAGMLLAYLGTTFAAISGVFLLRRPEFETPGSAAFIVAIFTVTALIGVLVIAAPQTVRGELIGTSDQFLRRLPGALAPAFEGKLAFVATLTFALPILGWLVGTLYVTALGHEAVGLFEMPAQLRNGDTLVALVLGLSFGVPWVMTLAYWLPGARMAVGGAIVLGVALALAYNNVLFLSPGLAQTMPWQAWVWWLVPLSLLVAWVSAVPGRRGGDHRRSARLGAATLIFGLLPPTTWLGAQVYGYHHPDLSRPEILRVHGLSPDLRYAIGRTGADRRWLSVPVRIDLASGHVEQLGAVGARLTTPTPQYWCEGRRELFAMVDANACSIVDATTGQRWPIAVRAAALPPVPDHLQARARADARRAAPFVVPGDGRAWLDGGNLVIEAADGTTTQAPWSVAGPTAAGDGILVAQRGEAQRLFDLRQRQFVGPAGFTGDAFSVGGVWFLRAKNLGGPWQRLAADGSLTPTALRLTDRWLARIDDHSALLARTNGADSPRLIAYRVATDTVDPVPLPEAAQIPAATLWPAPGWATACREDPVGRVWLNCTRHDHAGVLLAFDPADGTCRAVADGNLSLLTFDGRDHALVVQDERRIVRLDLRSGKGTVLFPRSD